VVATLAVLFALIGLNLAGRSSLATCCPAAMASLQAKTRRSIRLSGVLATAIASPAPRAPFIRRVAQVRGRPALQRWRFLARSAWRGASGRQPWCLWWPRAAAARRWMVTFKLMAFSDVCHVVWLIGGSLGQQSGIDARGR
jgi:thiol:disulfide interchange protein DsbD